MPKKRKKQRSKENHKQKKKTTSHVITSKRWLIFRIADQLLTFALHQYSNTELADSVIDFISTILSS